ncbi:nuclear transport factor 2 family protein [Polaribacter aestuariivivens]|nr:nuclear transport factor 2 family protein [Polaribacter aestuariivivens]
MKNIIFITLLISSTIFGQVDTEVHVFDIEKIENGYNLINGKNISNNKGYDNQPSFFDDYRVVFSSFRTFNVDIALYNLRMNNPELYYISETQYGGEYSPQRIPYSSDVSAVRLNKSGLQRFYRYHFKSKKHTLLIEDLKVAYPTWYDRNTVIASVIVNDSLELFICDIPNKKNISVAKNVGRSVHKIPNSDLISFVSKENKDYWLLKSLNPNTKEIKTITSLGKSEDVTWFPDGTLLISKGKSIYKFNPTTDKKPSLFYAFSDENINNITRMAVNKSGTKIAIVAEVSPRHLAQEQLDAYNNRDIDAFLKPFADNVKVYNFPNELSYEGVTKMRERYENFFKNTTDLHCELLNRIVYENKVIDHELVTVNGQKFKAVAIYTIQNGKIASVTFM